jgi:hypothetical protein
MRWVDAVVVGQCWLNNRWVTSRSVAITQLELLIAVRSRDASRSFARTSNRSVVRSTFRWCFLYTPPAVGFGHVRWSITRCNLHVVQISCLFEPHAMGANFATVLFPCGLRRVVSCFAQQAWWSHFRVIYVGVPCKVRVRLRLWHTHAHPIQVFSWNFICWISLSFTNLKYDFSVYIVW